MKWKYATSNKSNSIVWSLYILLSSVEVACSLFLLCVLKHHGAQSYLVRRSKTHSRAHTLLPSFQFFLGFVSWCRCRKHQKPIITSHVEYKWRRGQPLISALWRFHVCGCVCVCVMYEWVFVWVWSISECVSMCVGVKYRNVLWRFVTYLVGQQRILLFWGFHAGRIQSSHELHLDISRNLHTRFFRFGQK